MLDQTETTNNKLSFQKKNAKYYFKKKYNYTFM